MIPFVDIEFENIAGFFDEYDLTEEEKQILKEGFEEDRLQETIDMFVENYILPPSIKYQDTISSYLELSTTGPFAEEDIDKISRTVALLTVSIISLLTSNFYKFGKLFSTKTFKNIGLTDIELKRAITKETLSEFERLITGTLQNTQIFVTSSIRTLQREMIMENILIDKLGIKGPALDKEIERFKKLLRDKYPAVYKAALDGNIVATSRFIGDKEIKRHYKLSDYADMATRTTLLNIDRTANEIIARVNDEPVMEYYLYDSRKVKKERVICQDILDKKINGKSLLALDNVTAQKLGIMTIDEARTTPDFAMNVYCRHTLRRVPKQFLQELGL